MIKFRFEGLAELDRALGRADRGLRKNLRSGLRDIAREVATEARQIAESKTVRRTGDLIAGIQPYVGTGRSGVRSSARHGGYAYPNRLEYEGRLGAYGPRASLNPAVEAKSGDIERGLERVLDRVADDYEKG